MNKALDRFATARQGAKRFHAETIGAGVNPARCLGDWLTRVRKGDHRGIKRYYPTSKKTALAESSGTTGGYTVPVDLQETLIRDLSTGSLFRQYGAYVRPMRTATLELPVLDVVTAQAAGTAPYFGGALLQWQEENNKFGETAEPLFRNVVLKAWLLGGYAIASAPLVEDAIDLEQWFRRTLGESVAWYQDLAFFAGSGVGKPTGVINAPAAKLVTRGGGGTVAAADVQTMIGSLLPQSYHRAVWFCHPSVLQKLTAMTGWIPNGPLMLHGRPLEVTGKCATLGSRGDLILADPSLYIIGDREQIEVAYSREEPTAWKNNQGVFRVLSRVDGQPMTSGVITLQDGTSTVSPFVVLN
jgi:HK97 family phage major capsid protein